MEKQPISKSKVEGKPLKSNKRNAMYSIIVKVKKAHYVPSPVTLRAKIDPYLFTADANSEAIDNLEKDDSVESVSVSHPLPVIK